MSFELKLKGEYVREESLLDVKATSSIVESCYASEQNAINHGLS